MQIIPLHRRNAEPAGHPARHIDYLKDYGQPCNNMTVSLARTVGCAEDKTYFVLCGPDIDTISLMIVLPSMPEHDRDNIGTALYRTLFYSTAPSFGNRVG